MKKIGYALALLIPLVALAAGITATWTNPTTNTDSSSIPATGPGSLATATLSYGPCNAAQTAMTSVTGTIVTTEPASTAVVPTLAPGVWCASETVTNTYGNTSTASNVAPKTVQAPTPGAPSNFTW